MSGSLAYGGGENVLGIPGACATHNFTCLVRRPYATWRDMPRDLPSYVILHICAYFQPRMNKVYTISKRRVNIIIKRDDNFCGNLAN